MGGGKGGRRSNVLFYVAKIVASANTSAPYRWSLDINTHPKGLPIGSYFLPNNLLLIIIAFPLLLIHVVPETALHYRNSPLSIIPVKRGKGHD
jgi:hypothetical protein